MLCTPVSHKCTHVVSIPHQFREAAVDERIAYWIRTPQVPGSKLDQYSTISTELLTDYHHNSIIKLSGRCVWKVGEGFPDRILPKTLKWVVVYFSMTSHINGYYNDKSAVWQCTVTGRVSCPVSAVWYSCLAGQSITATSRHRRDMMYGLMCLKATLHPNKQTNKLVSAMLVICHFNIFLIFPLWLIFYKEYSKANTPISTF